MKINPIYNNQVSYKGQPNLVNKAPRILQAFSTEARKPTAFDKYLFRGYTFALNLKPKFNQKDIKNLFQLEGEEFIFESYEYLIKNLGIPMRLRPSIQITELNENLNMAYDYIQNKVEVSSKSTKISGSEDKQFIFCGLRHEIQHLKQNLDVFRHPVIGIEAINKYSQIYANSYIEMIENIISEHSSNELHQMAKEEGCQFQLYAELKYLKEENNIEDYEDSINQIKQYLEQDFIKRLTRFRKMVISEMGELKEGSREASRAEKFYDEFKSGMKYYTEDGSVHNGRYQYSVAETEAMLAENMTREELNGGAKGCFIRNNREESLRVSKNVEKINNKEKWDLSQEELKETLEMMETREKMSCNYKDEDDFIKHLTKFLYD